MNDRLALLRPYPFERLDALLRGISPPPGRNVHRLSIGEPRHAPPRIVEEALGNAMDLLGKYPSTRGSDALRASQGTWLTRRYNLKHLDPQCQLLPVNGTREALFAIAQTCVNAGALVGFPNPFYQIYEGAALLAGARTVLLDTTEDNGFLPDPADLTDDQWQAMDLLYLCTPGNPAGAVMEQSLLVRFIERALEHDVVLVSDECYSEIYPQEDAPPGGLLAACEASGNTGYRNCISMHSLSKRSNLPGLRSGFAAGDADIVAAFLRYRGYHGSAMPGHHQVASISAWNDEQHVRDNRARYRRKFAAVLPILSPVLDVSAPQGGFYLWPRTPVNDETFARTLFEQSGVVVLPGSYLGRDGQQGNPGDNRVRMALVASEEDCIDAAQRVRDCVAAL